MRQVRQNLLRRSRRVERDTGGGGGPGHGVGAERDGELREVGVARPHERVVHRDPPMGLLVERVVVDRPSESADARADAIDGRRWQT